MYYITKKMKIYIENLCFITKINDLPGEVRISPDWACETKRLIAIFIFSIKPMQALIEDCVSN